MSTNYYVLPDDPCPCCGRQDAARHLGLSAYGWCFSLHIYPNEGLNTLEDWKKFLEGKKIVNEYDSPVTLEEMLKIITERQGTRPLNYEELKWAVQGPKNLARCLPKNCAGYGEGTWDYVEGDFS